MVKHQTSFLRPDLSLDFSPGIITNTGAIVSFVKRDSDCEARDIASMLPHIT